MQPAATPPHPASYELRIRGHLDQSWTQWFGQPGITHEPDGTTTLLIHVTDQAELHGVLAKVRDLGIPLIAMTPAPDRPDRGPATHRTSPPRRRHERRTTHLQPDPTRAVTSLDGHGSAKEHTMSQHTSGRRPSNGLTALAPTTAASATDHPGIHDDVPALSLARLNLMRAGYLLMGVGLVVVKWPLLPQAHELPLFEGVTLCLLTAMSLLALLGLRYPARMLPLLVFETIWKVLWLGLVALPRAAAGTVDAATSEVIVNCSFVVVIIAVTPWRHVWRTYVRGKGDRWR